MPYDASQIPPASPTLIYPGSVRSHDPPIFNGSDEYDVEDWLWIYERVWYHNHESDLSTWPDFKARITQVFGRLEVRKLRDEERLRNRSQQPGENFKYIEDVVDLCKLVDPSMSESDKIRHCTPPDHQLARDPGVHPTIAPCASSVESLVTWYGIVSVAYGFKVMTNLSAPAFRQLSSFSPPNDSHLPVVAALLSGGLNTALAVFVLLPIVSRSGPKAPRGCLIARTPNGYAKGSLLQFKINGTSYNSVAFYGIPFGASTTGDGRFAEPRCAQPWHDLFNATYKRPPCAQSDTHFGRTYVIDASNTTEDCLHINVWVPGKCVTDLLGGENHRAVVFWLFGGSFVGGGNSYDFFDGRFVAGLGDVLVVTPNYRVTSFGFLNSGTGREVAGNMGLYDQLLALRWLRENVHRFGGDRDRILIAGQSAGAIASSMLMASPIMSQYGPYRRAFLMSGSAYFPLPRNEGPEARRSFSRLAANAGCQSARVADAVHCLRNRSAPDILKATKNISLFFMPSFEAPLFPGKMDSLERRFVAARARDTLISNVAMEGQAFFEMLLPDIAGYR
nr:acetylcholinesterase-1-like [Dermacentor andersoni]